MNCSQTGMSSGEEGRQNVCRDYDNVCILHCVGLCRQLPAEILVRRLGVELTCGTLRQRADAVHLEFAIRLMLNCSTLDRLNIGEQDGSPIRLPALRWTVHKFSASVLPTK